MRQTNRWARSRPPPASGEKIQLSFAWGANAEEPAVVSPASASSSHTDVSVQPAVADSTPSLREAACAIPAVAPAAATAPVLPTPATEDCPTVELRWDFEQTFPRPLEQAIEAGLLHEEDADPEALRSLHAAHAREVMALLSRIDVVADARRRELDPETGRAPRTEKAKDALRRRLAREPEYLRHTLDVLIDVYAEAFGDEAAVCFRTACEARHAGYHVVAQQQRPGAAQSIARDSKCPPASGWAEPDRSAPFPGEAEDDGLPLARPLCAAVLAGVFGFEDDGRPVDPSAEEVEAITRPQAERLIAASQTPSSGWEHSREILRRYEEDFGAQAAERLERYAFTVARAERADDEEGDEPALSREAAAVIGAAEGAEELPGRKRTSRRRKRR